MVMEIRMTLARRAEVGVVDDTKAATTTATVVVDETVRPQCEAAAVVEATYAWPSWDCSTSGPCTATK
jgi:hypothetical protein